MQHRTLVALLVLHVTIAHAATADIDGDGIVDSEEDGNGNGIVDVGETDWRNADTDGGGEADGSEIRNGRDPFLITDDMTFDMDGDGLTNGEEFNRGTNPRNPDSDGDGLSDRNDPFPLEKAFRTDADHDGVADEWEAQHGLSPSDPTDALGDKDGDGLTNKKEFTEDTDPKTKDTDRDGIADGEELERGTDPEESPCLALTENPPPIFPDLAGHWSMEFVGLLSRTLAQPSREPIIKGYAQAHDAPLFAPDNQISRFEILKIALMSSCIRLERGFPEELREFSDVPKTEDSSETSDDKLRRKVIYTASSLGIVQGYPDGSFRPERPVNRAEALKMILLAAQIDRTDDVAIPFPDIYEGEWYIPYVKQAISFDLVEGYGDGFFRPATFITRAEAAKITHHVMLSNPHVNGYVLVGEGG